MLVLICVDLADDIINFRRLGIDFFCFSRRGFFNRHFAEAYHDSVILSGIGRHGRHKRRLGIGRRLFFRHAVGYLQIGKLLAHFFIFFNPKLPLTFTSLYPALLALLGASGALFELFIRHLADSLCGLRDKAAYAPESGACENHRKHNEHDNIDYCRTRLARELCET